MFLKNVSKSHKIFKYLTAPKQFFSPVRHYKELLISQIFHSTNHFCFKQKKNPQTTIEAYFTIFLKENIVQIVTSRLPSAQRCFCSLPSFLRLSSLWYDVNLHMDFLISSNFTDLDDSLSFLGFLGVGFYYQILLFPRFLCGSLLLLA